MVVRTAFVSGAVRAERVENPAWLNATFVDNGIIDLVSTNNNQIIHGRRGTGKTHLLRVLETRLSEQSKTLVAYLDARTLGSSQLFTDVGRPLHTRCSGLFKDIISTVHNHILDWLVVNQTGNVDAALDTLAEMERQLLYTESDSIAKRSLSSNQESSGSLAGGSVGLGMPGASISATLNESEARNVKSEVEISTSESPKVIIPALYQVFHKLMDQLDLDRLVIGVGWQ